MTAADGDLRHTLPEGPVPIVDAVGFPDPLKELVGLEETLLIEQCDPSPTSLSDGDRDLLRSFGMERFIHASVGKQSTVPIALWNASHVRSVVGTEQALRPIIAEPAWERRIVRWASIRARAGS